MDERRIIDKAYSWLLTYGPKIVLAIIILIIGIWVIRFLKKWFKRFISRRNLDASLKPFLLGAFSIILQVFLFVALLQILGVQMTMFAALIGAFGVAAGLALSGTLQNFTSGILILLLKPFRVGDNIIAQAQEGTVTSIQLFYTVVLTFDNKTVIVPNGKLSNEVIINLSREGRRRLDIELKFPHKSSFDDVKSEINKAIDSSDDILKDPPVRIGIESVEPDGYKVKINIWINAHGFHDARLAFQERLINQFKKGVVKLPGME
ncbi:MAG: mechanosensitive ion channel family protein [Chitinophagaceae bacterium]|nr:MAG: mechanosensitive ion channel family protein [Chitinophagaceae bacterium]